MTEHTREVPASNRLTLVATSGQVNGESIRKISDFKVISVAVSVGAVATIISACSSTPVPLSVAVGLIENDFKTVGNVSLSAAASGNEIEKKSFYDKVQYAQCFYSKANPIIPAAVKDFSLALAGTFTNTGKATVTVAPTPGAGFEFDTARGQTQTITIPVTFAPLSDLPRVYISQQLSYLSSLPPDSALSDNLKKLKKDQVDEIMVGADTLKTYVSDLQINFKTVNCGAVFDQAKKAAAAAAASEAATASNPAPGVVIQSVGPTQFLKY
jgi:hypothetical protein